MRKLKNSLRKIIFRMVKPPVTYVYNSNSQAGEDKIVQYLFSSMGIPRISYIDIGANDPVSSNNTFAFYPNHGKGVLVEPDMSFNDSIRSVRPKDIIVNAAISDKDGEADFFIFDPPSLNTLSAEEAEIRSRSGIYKLVATKKIRLITVDAIIKEYFQYQLPHLVSLDVEGMDFKILNAFDFEKYPIPVWIVETCGYSENHIKPKVTSIIDLMLSRGYFVFADTYINTIFVHKQWFENYHAT